MANQGALSTCHPYPRCVNDKFITENRRFFQKELPYSLISDPKRSLIGVLGAGDGNKTKRSHFVFEKGGKLLDRKMPVKPADRCVLCHCTVFFIR
jgi:peroxiredoxin